MGKFLDVIQKELKNTDRFINNIAQYIDSVYGFKNVKLDTEESINEYRAVLIAFYEHNNKVLKKQQASLKKINNILNNTIDIDYSKAKASPKDEEIAHNLSIVPKERVCHDDLINTLFNQEDITPFINNLREEELDSIKFAVYKIVLDLEKQIRYEILHNPSKDISSLQKKVIAYRSLLRSLHKKEIKNKEQTSEYQISEKIILVPNKHNISCILEDAREYPERRSEISIMLNKIMSGNFFKNKDIKSLVSYDEKLCEFRHPNGLRVLFIKMPNDYYALCSLFFKDKQKSTMISQTYEEAIKRFNDAKSTLENYRKPDFKIEQAELIGELYGYFEDGKSLDLKRGE